MDVVADVCQIPVGLNRGDVSVWTLADESGYRDSPAVLSVEAVSSYLALHPALVDAWLGYSADKRVSSGWYIVERSAGMFEVGYYTQGTPEYFYDRDRACAEFIIREVCSIR